MRRIISVRARDEVPTRPLQVVLVGLGPIGRNVADECARRGPQCARIVGAVDIDPSKAGKTLGELWGPGRPDGSVRVVARAAELSGHADVALLTTTSRLETLEPQLEALFVRGLHVVSTAEELFYPSLADRALTDRIDNQAKRYKVSVTGAGINPGFLMDVLPVVLSVASGPPLTVHCQRYVNLAQRRLSLQAKAGLGLEADEFRRRAEAIQIGHVGLIESAAYLAAHLGLPVRSIEESLDPVLADAPFSWCDQSYDAGRVIGFEHRVRAWCEGQDADSAPVKLDLRMAYHQDDPHDRVTISGTPPIDMTIRPCVAGDAATAAVIVNLAARTVQARPGLRLIHELGLEPQCSHYRITKA